MKQYLLIYDRSTGRLLDAPLEFEDRAAAMDARFARELTERSHPQVEVVLIGAGSLAELQNTHSRYFQSASSLLKSVG